MKPELNKEAVLNKSRTDKFLLVLTVPKCLKNMVTRNARTTELVNQEALQFSLVAAPVPPISIPHVDIAFGGQTAKISSMFRPTYPPLQVQFTVDNRFNNYWFIYKWLDIINNDLEGIYELTNKVTDLSAPKKAIVGTLKDYATIATLYGRDEYNKNVIRFDYHGCFPTELAGITYDYRQPDEMKSSFTFQYSQFVSELI